MRKTCDSSAIDDDHGVERPEQVQGKICQSTFGGGYSGDDRLGETDQFPSTVHLDRKRQAIAGGYSKDVLRRNIPLQTVWGTEAV